MSNDKTLSEDELDRLLAALTGGIEQPYTVIRESELEAYLSVPLQVRIQILEKHS